MKKTILIGSAIFLSAILTFSIALNAKAEEGSVAPVAELTSVKEVKSVVKSDAKVEARITNFKDKAGKEIDRRVESLNKLLSRVEGMKRVSDEGKASMKTTFNAQITGLSGLKAKILAETNVDVIKTDVKSITESYRIFALVIPQGEIVTAADRIVTIGSKMNDVGLKLKLKLDEALAAGKDITALNVTLNDIGVKIINAQSLAQAAVSMATTLNPDNGNQTIFDSNKKALVDAHAKIKLAHADLVTARKDIETIVKALKGFKIDTSVTAGGTSIKP